MNKIPEFSDETIPKLAKLALEILTKYSLCESCLGRQFALLGRGISNFVRGQSLKIYLTLLGAELIEIGVKDAGVEILKQIAIQGNFQPAVNTLENIGISIDSSKECYVCEGFMNKLGIFKDLIIDRLQEWEYETFLIGSKIPETVIDREDGLRAALNLKYGESIKAELNREIGKRIVVTEKEVDFDTPDVLVVINPITLEIEVNVNPLLIFGRYRKLKRGISQTKWICWSCEGKGCDECKGTGLRYEHSVEVFIAEPILKAAQGNDYKFHGGGREDIDARMLGEGRPFVVEIKEPKKRKLDLASLKIEINRLAEGNVEVSDLEWSDRETVRSIKALAQVKEKIYRLIVETKDMVAPETIMKADEVLTGAMIQQKTPQRVIHRRANKLRMKKVYEFKTTQVEPKKLEVIVRCQGGCYVKELCNGDNGRTQPSLSELLNTQVTVIELDVLHVD